MVAQKLGKGKKHEIYASAHGSHIFTNRKGRSCFHRCLSFYPQLASCLLGHCSFLLATRSLATVRSASYWNAYLLLIFTEPGGTFDTVRKNLTENVIGKLSKRNFLNYFCPFLSLILFSKLLILSLESVYYRLYMTQDETWTWRTPFLRNSYGEDVEENKCEITESFHFFLLIHWN